MSVSSQVLVLNKSWVPVAITTVEAAILKLFKYCTTGVHKGEPKARIIDPTMDFQVFTWEDWARIKPKDGEDIIRGIGTAFRLFDVIMLTEYDKQPIHRTQYSRSSLWRRDHARCQYCGVRCSTTPGNEGTVDHVIPKSQSGMTTWENTVLCCLTCNGQKANRTPEQAVRGKKDRDWRGPSPMRLLSIPKKPSYNMLKHTKKMKPNWTSFLSAAYWHVELENDNPPE